MLTIAEKLLEMNSQIEEAKEKKFILTGQKSTLMTRLKDDFKCTSLEEGEALLEKTKKKIDDLTVKIDEAMTKLERSYDWGF